MGTEDTAPGPGAPSGLGGAKAYAFGDVELAALRLELMDRVFAWPTQALLEVASHDRIELAVDLGCGPGLSTRRIHEQLHPARLVGLDTSTAFLRGARSRGAPAQWVHHDATVVPLPTGRADLLHARFLLTHLPDPEAVLLSWLSQLTPGGLQLVQDDEEIVAHHPTLTTYEEMARSLVAARGGDLWVGARLSRVDPPAGFERVVNRVHRHCVPVALAAQLFALNFEVWRHDPHIAQTYPGALVDEVGTALRRIAAADEAGDVVFKIRQLAYRRGEA